MMNIIIVIIGRIMMEIKNVCLIEKLVIVGLIIIPVPFTFEGYMIARTFLRKKLVRA